MGKFTIFTRIIRSIMFLAAVAALYLTLVSHWVSESLSGCHFRISTQILTFETWDPSDIWSERCLDKKTKDKKTKKHKDKKTKRQKDRKTKPKKSVNIATSGQFCTLGMFFFANFNDPSTLQKSRHIKTWKYWQNLLQHFLIGVACTPKIVLHALLNLCDMHS